MNTQKEIFDAIVIGAGSGGLNIAVFLNSIGLKVLLIDKSDRSIGGDCLNFGCVPSKALIHVARKIKAARSAEAFGVTTNGEVDMRKVIEYVHGKREHIREHENADYFRKQGLTVALGTAKFTGKNTVSVDGVEYQGKKIVLATGSRPRKLDIPGIEGAKVFTNETIFDIDYLPKKLIVVGGGPIGIELGQAFKHLGSEVCIVDRGDQVLPREDRDIAEVLHKQLEKDGVKFHFNSNTKEIKGNTLVIEKKDGTVIEEEFDAMLVAIGRVLNTEGLDLERAGIQMTEDKRKIKVNEYLETTNPNVLVCGDIAGGHQFTHAAEVHAGVVLSNFFTLWRKKLNTDGMAWVTYTTPEIGTFGVNEKTLKERGVSYDVVDLDFSEDDRAIVDSGEFGRVKIFVDKKGIVFGGSMVGLNAGELIQELILLQSQKLPLDTLMKKVYPYPTATRINRRAAQAVAKKKLTPFAKKLLRILFH